MRWKDRGCAALSVAMGLFVPSAAQAATVSQAYTTPGEHVFVVPPAVFSVNIRLVGGNGGAGAHGTTGGAGATEVATLFVNPGQKLYAEVGGDGGAGDQTGLDSGGYNGGGAGGEQFVILVTSPSGGGGGGASDVRTVPACPIDTPACSSLAESLASRLVVAGGGGGGGGGFSGTDSASGGPGGASDAAGTGGQTDPPHFNAPGGGGGRGKTTSGGAAGGNPAGGSGVTAGALGAGGAGGLSGGGGGGGGGGGLYGGGGGDAGAAQLPDFSHFYGAGGGGGGGGASTLPPGPPIVSGLSLLPTDTGAEPQITFTWTLPPPTATTSAASAVTFSSATLHGTVNPNATPLSGCQFTISPKPPGGSTISCTQQIGSGTSPVPVSAQLLGLSPSTTYTVRLSAADAQGQSTGAPITFRTLPPPPQVSGFAAKVVRRHGRRQGSVSLKVSEAATLVVTFEQKKGKRWVALKRTASAKVRSGTAKLGFTVRGLRPGRYRLTVVATNAVNERSRPQQTTFKLTR